MILLKNKFKNNKINKPFNYIIEKSIVIIVEIENNKIDNKSASKITQNMIKSNNLSNLFKLFVILLNMILKITKLSKILFIKTSDNEVIISLNKLLR